jgi:ribosomal protein S12 methylthiotransferase accessory factor
VNRPKLKDHLHYEIVPPGNVFILSEDKQSVLTGAAYKHLVPYLNGQHTVGELMGLLADRLPGPQLYYVLHQLQKDGYIVDADGAVSPHIAPYCYALNIDAQTASQRHQQSHITLKSMDSLAAKPLREALYNLEIELGDDGDLTVIVVDDYLQTGLADWNREALASGKPWLLVKLIGHTAWLGPLFVPGETACWECLAQRLGTNRQLESYIQRRKGDAAPLPTARVALPTTIELAANLAATEIFKWLAQGKNEQLKGQLLTLNTLSMEMQTHQLVRRPQCPACGTADLMSQPRAISLNGHRGNGNGRQHPASDSFDHTQHLISPITGIITWLVETTPETNGLHYTYSAGHSFALVRDNLHWLQQSLASRTGGKGRSQIQAKMSAVGEAVERYAGVYRGDEPVVRGSYQSLTPDAIHLQECLNFSEQQYQNRHQWNNQQKGGYIHVVPNPLVETQVLDWTPLWSLTEEKFKYLPSSFCYFGHPESAEFFFCAGNSSGTAAGNNIEEAILSGFYELVERDSAAIWWYNRVQRPSVNLDSLNLPYIKQLQDYYTSLNREFWVLDITSDLGIPVFAAISRRVDRQPEDIVFGFAADLDVERALLGAIAEMNQFLPAVSRQDKEGKTQYNFVEQEAIAWWQTANVAEQGYLLGNGETAVYTDYPQLASDHLGENVQKCVAIAAAAGLETLVLDQTRPDLVLHSCRVVVPGLRHFWRRLGPGRLYDVPVQLGWLDKPLSEEDLNPFSIFF